MGTQKTRRRLSLCVRTGSKSSISYVGKEIKMKYLALLLVGCLLANIVLTKAEEGASIRTKRGWFDKIVKKVKDVISQGKTIVYCTRECSRYWMRKRNDRPPGCCCGRFFWEKGRPCNK